jgi:hypothetical protein
MKFLNEAIYEAYGFGDSRSWFLHQLSSGEDLSVNANTAACFKATSHVMFRKDKEKGREREIKRLRGGAKQPRIL